MYFNDTDDDDRNPPASVIDEIEPENIQKEICVNIFKNTCRYITRTLVGIFVI